MRRPTIKEIVEAVGFTVGSVKVRISGLYTRLKSVLTTAAIAALLILLTAAVFEISEIVGPVTIIQVVFVLACGFVLFSASAFTFVLFGYFSILVRPTSAVSQNFQRVVARAANPIVAAPQQSQEPAVSTGGSFTVYDEERASYQEQLDDLQKSGILKDVDLDDLMKEGHLGEIEFPDKMKEQFRGEE